jgi:hypothetical protein
MGLPISQELHPQTRLQSVGGNTARNCERQARQTYSSLEPRFRALGLTQRPTGFRLCQTFKILKYVPQ